MIERFAGRYALLKHLGRGGMGDVYLARDLTAGTECALKRLPPGVSSASPEVVRREFESLTRVRHPAVVAVYELGFADDGSAYYTMEYVPGLTADRALARGDWASLSFVAAQLAHGLEALHAAGVSHGDLKPSNLLIVPGTRPDGRPAGVRLLDFGLAGLLGRMDAGHRGTPGYAAPEVVRGQAPDAASDLYGLGATLYTLSAGRPAFEGRSATSLLRAQQAGPPSSVPLEEAGVPAPLIQLILRLMAPEPGERPRDAREVRREIERLHPAARRPLADRLQTVLVVGRERELARVEQWLAGAARSTRAIVVAGRDGAGKSALFAELAARAALGGRSVVQVPCATSSATGAAALVLLRRLAAGPAADANGGSALAEALRARSNEALSEADLDPLVEAAATTAASRGRRREVTLVLLDDSEALDPLSWELARRLALHPAADRLKWVWARRGAEGANEDERVLLDAGIAEVLELGDLDRAASARLAATRLNEPAPEALEAFLWARAAGHPGLSVELLRAAAEAGALRESDSGLLVDVEALERLGVPESFEASLLARWRALPDGPRAAGAALAAWGRAVEPGAVRAIEPAADDAALAALRDAGLAVREETGRVAIAPPALGERLLRSVGEPERRALHRAVLAHGGLTHRERFHHLSAAGEMAAALEAAAVAFEEQPDERLATAAATLAESAARGEAATWHERAARVLAARGRYAAAIAPLERALELEPAADSHWDRRLMLATAHLRVGQPEDVARVVQRGMSLDSPPAYRSQLMSVDAARLSYLGDRASALASAERALELAEAADDHLARGAAAMAVASVLVDLGRLDEAQPAAEKALEAYGRAADPIGPLRARATTAAIAWKRHRLQDATRIYAEALAEARRRGYRLAIEELLVSQALLMTEQGRWHAMHDAFAEAARIALEDGRSLGAALAIASLAQADGLMGRPRPALRRARAAIRLARRHRPRLEASAWRALAQAHRTAGRLSRAERAARHGLALAVKLGLPSEQDWARIELGRVKIAAGRWKEAGEIWDHALETPRPAGSVEAAVLSVQSGRAALRRGDHATAATRLAAADASLQGGAAGYATALADQLRAELALAQGRPTEGVAGVKRTLDALGALPAPPDRAMAALEFARLALAGDGESRVPVLAWLDEAAAGFERLGDHNNRERALALSVRWLRRWSAPAAGGARDRTLIESVSRLLNSLSDLRELAQRAMEMAVEQLDAERGVLLLADPETGRLTPMAEHGAVDAATRRDAVGYSRRVVQHVAESGGSLLISDAPSDPRVSSQSVVDLRLRSIVCVPMYLGGRVVGAVYLDDSRRPEAFGDADRGLLEGFAHLMAIAIEKSRGHEEVQRANQLLVGENLTLRQQVGTRFQAQNLIGTSSEMQRVLATLHLVAQSNSSVLLTGENGTGKELIARTLHHSGKRRLRPFVAVNCGAIPETLLETELFGILANVATDVRARDGRFVQADGGTLFLDEIGEMPLKQQVALLSAIANREITPVGGGKPIAVDVRIIAATNRDLRQQIEHGAFREDLYYRLNVIPIEVPPLRDRKADIPALAQHFLAQFAKQQEREMPQMSPEFLAALMQSDWPGNVRELQNYIERVLAMSPGRVLYPDPLPRDLEGRPGGVRLGHARRLPDLVGELERRMTSEALERAGGNQSLAARELGLTEQSLRYRLRKYGFATARSKRRISRKLR